jgi:aromatic-L-amino-acid decarboxylase
VKSIFYVVKLIILALRIISESKMEKQMLSSNKLGDMPADEFKKYGYELIDWIADYLADIEKFPVLPNIKPGEIKSKLPKIPPASSEGFENILVDVDEKIIPGVTHWNHPNFMAYFNSTSSGPGILAELLSAALNTNGMLWKTSPSTTELERVAVDWLRQMLGLPEAFWGIIYDTASVSSMHAIACAREEVKEYNFRKNGLSGGEKIPKLRLYASEHAHSSIEKGAILLGIGIEGVRKIPVDNESKMIPEKLSEAINEDRKNNWRPFCVVATVGTTSTTSIDPVNEIADICKKENLWLHVDAAHAGVAAMIPEMKYIFNGVEKADSLVVNPHKWMFTPVDLSLFYTRKPDVLKRAFSLVPEYLKTKEDNSAENLMDYGIQLGRRFRALKLWLIIRYFGVNGIIERLREHIRLGKLFARWIDENSDFERMAPTPFSTICFRAHPTRMNDEGMIEWLNEQLMQRVNETGKLFISHTKLNGKFALRVSISGLRTEERHVRGAWDLIQLKLKELS